MLEEIREARRSNLEALLNYDVQIMATGFVGRCHQIDRWKLIR